jgi:hypothetical protein
MLVNNARQVTVVVHSIPFDCGPDVAQCLNRPTSPRLRLPVYEPRFSGLLVGILVDNSLSTKFRVQ